MKDFSIFGELTPEYFGAQCIDTDGNAVTITASFVTTPVAGATTSILLVATSGGKTTQTTIENVKIYGTPTISVRNTTIKVTCTERYHLLYYYRPCNYYYSCATSICIRSN